MDLARDRTVEKVISRLRAAVEHGSGTVHVEGTWGGFAPMLAACVFEKLRRPVLYITAHGDDADAVADDLQTLCRDPIEALVCCEGSDLCDLTDEAVVRRVGTALRVRDQKNPFMLPASIQAICQAVVCPDDLAHGAIGLKVGDELEPAVLAGKLVDCGFERVDRIDMPGQVAARGGIVDICAALTLHRVFTDRPCATDTATSAEAVRIEFFGDRIESIRMLDLDTQLSSGQLTQVELPSVRPAGTGGSELFLKSLPADTIVIMEEPADIEQVAEIFIERSEPGLPLYRWSDIAQTLRHFVTLCISRFAAGSRDFLKVDVAGITDLRGEGCGLSAAGKTLDKLCDRTEAGWVVDLYCHSQAEIKRITEIITDRRGSLPKNLHLLKGYIHQGFMMEGLKYIAAAHHELSGQYLLQRVQRPMRPGAPIDTLEDLKPGDYVVHLAHGVGRFAGVETITDAGRTTEYLTVEFADTVKIHVAASNIDMVHKYIGVGHRPPKLATVGSRRWQRQKDRVAESVRALAGELLEVQARRHAMGGIAFGADSTWQREFEESFGYVETPDQSVAAAQIKADMQRPVAMDRLLCGDVGYGKTELAMRAAFKAVDGGRQVAVLVPTTVLSVQHARTFSERFADFPVSVEVLNRFRTASEAAEIIDRAKSGRLDILIGTHRLLSRDVAFKDLGLVIVDEEQRFGVAHKEKLKRLRYDVDVLTMTATPIPRTLHMAILGLRDISSLGTPPLDRRNMVTEVTAFNPELLKKAVWRELDRRGQVFFLHNRVKTIDKKACQIKNLFPDTPVRVAVAHGQMNKGRLESTMLDFVNGGIDLLVCTTIIESGLDIPSANTIFIDNADRFGLAELHQLRGRVGRYKHKAYAYMLIPSNRPVTPVAARRLKAIEQYSYLGAGFKIALRDMEIRGAGNILGPEQSGHIQMVGYQIYCSLLSRAVRNLANTPAKSPPLVTLDLGFSGHIPRDYIPTDRYRMDLYRRIATAADRDDLARIESEMVDIYGPVPPQTVTLLQLAGIRINAGSRGIRNIAISGNSLVLVFGGDVRKLFEGLFGGLSANIDGRDPRTVYVRPGPANLRPDALIKFLGGLLK